MKVSKKIISVVLVLSMLICTFAISVSAKDSSEEAVACMYVAHKGRNYNLSGHTWIYIQNLTNHNITVGIYTVAPKKGVSVGTYGYAIGDGRGVYYNVEAYRYNKAKTTDYVYLSKNVTEEGLADVSEKILRSGYWDYLVNCAFFAFTTWNETPGMPLIYLLFPMLNLLEILLHPSHKTGFAMYYPKKSEVFKQVGFRDKAVLVPTDPDIT